MAKYEGCDLIDATGLTLGALGGPHTFNGLAADAMAKRYPQFAKIIHYPTSAETMAAAMRGEVDATCAPEQTSVTGFHPGMLARMVAPDSRLYVIAEVSSIYHCSLLGKPGADIAQVRRVLGHDGSIAHSRAWLDAQLPNAKVEIVTTHSEVAAQAVLSGDGSIASVGSPGLAAKFGLAELAKDVDGGSAVNYWAVSLRPLFDQAPTRLAVTGRFTGDAQMSELIGALLGVGFSLTTVYPRPSGRALDDYDCLLRFKGRGRLDAVRAQVALRCARLAGAWVARG
jgi:prephenate dehydratase